jgi:hypothetical protein
MNEETQKVLGVSIAPRGEGLQQALNLNHLAGSGNQVNRFQEEVMTVSKVSEWGSQSK